MKSYILLCLFFSLIALSAKSQCTGANIPPAYFTAFKADLSKPFGGGPKLELAVARLNAYCYTSGQIKELTLLLDNEADRLEFAKAAYDRVGDPQNYKEVFDAFFYISTVFELYEFIGHGSAADVPAYPDPTNNIRFPDARFYYGEKGCASIMNQAAFESSLAAIRMQSGDLARYNFLKSGLIGKEFSIEQLMLFCLELENENYRLDLLNSFSLNSYDRLNYPYASQLLQNPLNQEVYLNHIKSLLATPEVDVVVLPVDSFAACRVDDNEFKSMLSSIAGLSFSSTKVSQAELLIKSRCFTAIQIRELIKLMNFESSKLELAKYAYEYCSDKKNYFLLNDAFSFSSSIEELNNYINSR